MAGAWTFYTVLPSPSCLKPSFQRIARFAPLIGVIIGTLQALAWLIMDGIGWPKESLALISIAISSWITGGLHFDGLMDTADGVAAGSERCLEAMRDSRVGASGVQALIICLSLQFAALLKLGPNAVLAIPIACFLGRCSPLWAIGHFPYLHKEGSEDFHRLNWKGWKEFQPALLIILLAIPFLLLISPDNQSNLRLMLAIGAGIAISFTIPQLIGSRLGGHSGDSYGASLVVVETLTLLIFALLLKAR